MIYFWYIRLKLTRESCKNLFIKELFFEKISITNKNEYILQALKSKSSSLSNTSMIGLT